MEGDALETDQGRVGVPELDAPETVRGPPETAGGLPKMEWEKHKDLIPEDPRVEKVLQCHRRRFVNAQCSSSPYHTLF
jgi:hypothetical protein